MWALRLVVNRASSPVPPSPSLSVSLPPFPFLFPVSCFPLLPSLSPPLFLYPHVSDKKENGSIPPAVVMPTPSKRGRKKKSMLPREGPVTAHALPTGSDALILAHLAAGGQVSLMVKDLHISMLGYLK